MWPCEDADLLRCTIINQSRKTNHIMPCKTVQSLRFQCIATMILIFFVQISHAHASNISTSKVSRDMHHYHGSRYTINELLNTRFTSKISDDIDMDPCKASEFMGDIALPNIAYDNEWQQQRLNKTFQQELEQLKQEVYHEGLQVEEEGLTDIIRKKTKLPPESNPNHHEEPSKNDAVPIEPNQPTSTKEATEKNVNGTANETAATVDEPNVDNANQRHVEPQILSSSSEKPAKNFSNVFGDIDEKKIQSDTKDIESTDSQNIVVQRRNKTMPNIVYTQPSEAQTIDRNAANANETSVIESSKLNDTTNAIDAIGKNSSESTTELLIEQAQSGGITTEIISTTSASTSSTTTTTTTTSEQTVKRRRRHHQRRRDMSNHSAEHKKSIDNSYSARLERLREELNRPSVTEVIRMQQLEEQKQSSRNENGDAIELTPFQSVNTTTEPFESLRDVPHHHRVTRAATAKKERIWDYGVIPYEIDANFSGVHKALFKQAMKHWENFTCIKFVERNPSDHMNYIIFTIRPCGCCSFVGKRGNGGQAISIGKNCDKFGIVVHELGHVVGFWHEHTRPDRENHVVIERANILTGQEYNFNKLTGDEVNSLGLPYDYDSIMHYARNTFSKGTYLDTILPVEVKGKKRPEIGQRLRLSEGDISQANLLYKCPKCGRTFQENSATFTSPSYYLSTPSNEPESCEWRITATHGEKIVLNITDLDIFKSNNCRSDYLEIRDGYWQKSPILGRYCGSGRIMELIKSSSSRMLLTLVTSHNRMGLRGFAASYEAVCGGDLTLESGNQLESPNYPLEYLPNKECIWRITVQEDHQVALKFQSFEVENHDNCVYDYVEVRDGASPDSRLIGVFCGYKVPPDMRSTTNKMFVKFVSDGSVQKAGFSATFIKELDECELKDHGCEHECINTLGGYQCACHIGYELHSDKKTCENACGGIIEALNGTITSPSFPDVYPVSKDCTWEIVAPEQYRITLNFTHFDLEGNHFHMQECDYDSLSVYSKMEDNNLKRHGVFCGERMPPLVTSEGNVMRIEFRSDNTVQKSGFAAVFFTDIDECAVNNGGCMHECKNTIGSYVCSCHNGYVLHENGLDCKEGGCKYEITAPHGTIQSPNYPDYYPRKKDCVWHFTTTPGHRIRLHFLTFEIEPHQECAYDYVQIFNGDSVDSYTLGKFCGTKIPHPISASSNEMFMVFKSDASVQRQGFTATHTTACGGHLKATTQVKHFYSHAKFADNNYDHDADCDWTIEADTGRNVHLTFLTFDIEDEKACAYDYVDIFGGADDYSSPLYGRYCGTNKPQDIISMNEALLVRFRSDGTMNKKGFSASYVAVDPFEGSEEEISSDSSEMATQFPTFGKNVYVSNNKLGRAPGTGDATDEDTDNEEENYNEYDNYNSIKHNNRNRKAEPENGLID